MAKHDGPHDRQTQTGSPIVTCTRGVEPSEPLEDGKAMLLWYAVSVVFDHDRGLSRRRRGERKPSAARAVPGRVRQQVLHDALQLVTIAESTHLVIHDDFDSVDFESCQVVGKVSEQDERTIRGRRVAGLIEASERKQVAD